MGSRVDWAYCCTPSCRLRYAANGHRHCCKACRVTCGRDHTRRCLQMQRRLRNIYQDEMRYTESECYTTQCNRIAGVGFSCCCSTCFESRGQVHSRRCQSRTYYQGTVSVRAADPMNRGEHVAASAVGHDSQINSDGITEARGSQPWNDECNKETIQEDPVDLESMD